MIFPGKYKVGDLVALKIGNREPRCVAVLECVMRDRPHYKIDWEKIGYNAILNTVAIPEGSLSCWCPHDRVCVDVS